jgi:hypothetical protein
VVLWKAAPVLAEMMVNGECLCFDNYFTLPLRLNDEHLYGGWLA